MRYHVIPPAEAAFRDVYAGVEDGSRRKSDGAALIAEPVLSAMTNQGKPAPVPTAVALDGWVDVKLSTVPNVVIASTKGNWYKVYASRYTGDLSVSGRSDAPIMNCARGTYSAELAMGFKTVRKTPAWAIVLGIIGLLFFLLGALLFLVKENRQEETRILTVTLADGRSFSGPYVDAASYG